MELIVDNHPESMKELIAIGYPEEKLKWYRGGMQSWLSLGLTTVNSIKREFLTLFQKFF